MSLLITNLHHSPAGSGSPTLDWALLDDEGTRRQGGYQVTAEPFEYEDSEANSEATRVVLVPAEDVLIARVQVPPKQRRHLHKALPFLVEEVLAEPVEDMHLVLDKVEPNGSARVLAVTHAAMERWLETCSQFGEKPHYLTPETLVIAAQPHELVLCLEHENSLIKAGSGVAMKTATGNLSAMLELIFADQEATREITHIRLVCNGQYADTDQAQITALQAQFEGEGKEVSLETCGNLFDYLCQSLAEQMETGKQHPVNLLQSPYQPAQSGGKKLSWRLLGYAAAFCAGLQLLFNVGMGFYLNNKSASLKEEIEAQYRALFPEERRIVDVRVQMENHLKRAADTEGDTGFIRMMGVVGYQMRAMGQTQSMQLQQVRYDRAQGTMMLDIDVRQVQQLDRFKQALVGQGLAVTILSASEEREWVKGRLKIGREV